jgi:hypothetical protein
MTNTMQALKSKTIIAALVSFAATLAGFLGLAVDPEVQVQMTDATMSIISAIGALGAIYGRVVATKVIK